VYQLTLHFSTVHAKLRMIPAKLQENAAVATIFLPAELAFFQKLAGFPPGQD
jgi:hypothetical protein